MSNESTLSPTRKAFRMAKTRPPDKPPHKHLPRSDEPLWIKASNCSADITVVAHKLRLSPNPPAKGVLMKKFLVQLPLLIALTTAASLNFAILQANSQGDSSQSRIARVLHEEVTFLASNPQYDYPLPVIVRLKEGATSLPEFASSGNRLDVIHSVRKTLYASQIAELLDNPSVDYVTFDAPLRTFSDLKPFLESGGVYFENAPFLQGYKGSGINVAIVDSGIGIHSEIAESRIVGSVDFTRGWPIYGSSGDPYGHGTAVAGIVGAGGENYQGVAPEVGLVDVKVIDENGQGRTSNLILALEWIYNIRYHSGIRVVNLSLGHPPYESYKDDPLGQAVEKLVRAGIVVVASAGNLGRLEGYPYI